MTTLGSPADDADERASSTGLHVRDITVGRWTLMWYPTDEVADECRCPDAEGKRCASCGAKVDPARRHPAATAPDDPSMVYLFCSEDCRTAWVADDGD